MAAQEVPSGSIELHDTPAADVSVHDPRADEVRSLSTVTARQADDRDGLRDRLPLLTRGPHTVVEVQVISLRT
jgi:hypothetical protein